VPVTAAPPAVVASRKLAVVSVELVIGSENVAETEEFSATPVALVAGAVAETVGGVVSETAPSSPPPPQAATINTIASVPINRR